MARARWSWLATQGNAVERCPAWRPRLPNKVNERSPRVTELGGGVKDGVPLARFRASEYTLNISMPTSVHIPKLLLVAVDRRARALKISRNRLIVQALEREVTEGSSWSPDFFARLESLEAGVGDAADEMLKAIQNQRRSKKPVRL